MLKNEALVRLKWLFSAAERAGVELAPMKDLPEASSELTFWKHYLKCLGDTAELAGDSTVGLRLGQELSIVDLGQHSYILVNAAQSTGDYLRLHARYSQLAHSVSHFDFQPGDKIGRLYFRPVKSMPDSAVEEDLALAACVQLMKSRLGMKWRPRRVVMQRAKPEPLEAYRDVFGHNLVFEKDESFIEVDNRDLNVAMTDADPLVQGVLRSYADQLLKANERNKSGVSAKVKLLIMDTLHDRKCDQEAIAERLLTSRATLQRRLEQEGTSFRALRAEVIDHLAKKFLSESEESISHIAERLGFANASGFIRAFQAGNPGMTPAKFRRESRTQLKG